MSILYNENQNNTIDDNGTEELATASNPNWFAGTGSELGRAASNIGTTLGNLATVTGQQQMQVTAGLAASQGQPEYAAKLHSAEPIDPATLPKLEKPDAANSGAAAILLGDLFQQTPTIAASLVNPAAGFTMGAITGDIEGQQEAAQMAVTGQAARYYGAINALEMGIGGALPGIGGIGDGALIKYASRFVVGGVVNSAQSEAGRFGRAAVLDSFGFTDQAQQLRQWDMQAAATQFILGGIFNLGGGHVRDRENVRTETGVGEAIVPEGVETGALRPEPATGDSSAVPAETTADNVPVQNMEGLRLSRGDFKQVKSQEANALRHLARIDQERSAILSEPPAGSGKQLADARQRQQQRLADLEQQRQISNSQLAEAQDRLEQHYQYGRSRITPEQADAATHTAVQDNFVTESAPGLAADVHTEASHTRALTDALDAVQNGRAVDVSAHFADDHTFITHGDLDAGAAERQQLAGSNRTDAIMRAAQEQSVPEAREQTMQPGQISDTIPQPFMVLRDQVAALRAEHPELADTIAPHIDRIETEHQYAHAEAQQYEIAAACALVHGA